MDTFLIIMIYLLIWWLVLFAVLPFGIRPPANPVPGQSTGAPERAHLVAKLIATTLLAALATWLAVWLIESSVFYTRP